MECFYKSNKSWFSLLFDLPYGTYKEIFSSKYALNNRDRILPVIPTMEFFKVRNK